MYCVQTPCESFPGLWAVAWKDESLPPQVVMPAVARGFSSAIRLGETFREFFGDNARIPLITWADRCEFMARYFPATIEYEREILEDSMQSAAL
jgi:hypothetical protein